jgi:hypothetical protein
MEEDLKIMAIRNWHTVTRNWKEWKNSIGSQGV